MIYKMDAHDTSENLNQPTSQDLPGRTTESASSPWDAEVTIVACTHCQARYLALTSHPTNICPNCHASALTRTDQNLSRDNEYLPELIIPFKVQPQVINQAVENFTRGIPYPPEDLNSANLSRRFIPIFFPAWLIDAQIDAVWQAELGFDYQVVSHQDRYDQNSSRWISHEIKETRIRWEPRSGSLSRQYLNVISPALENERAIQNELGSFPIDASVEFNIDHMPSESYVAIPDRPKNDAWNDVVIEMKKIAASECRTAGSAEHLRNYKWNPQFSDQIWTLFLRPAYASYYIDDEGKPQNILIHGTSGRVTGQRKASMRKAQTQALTIFIIAAVIFLFGLMIGAVGLVFPPALLVGGLMLLVGVFAGLAALIPLFRAWQFNQNQR